MSKKSANKAAQAQVAARNAAQAKRKLDAGTVSEAPDSKLSKNFTLDQIAEYVGDEED